MTGRQLIQVLQVSESCADEILVSREEQRKLRMQVVKYKLNRSGKWMPSEGLRISWMQFSVFLVPRCRPSSRWPVQECCVSSEIVSRIRKRSFSGSKEDKEDKEDDRLEEILLMLIPLRTPHATREARRMLPPSLGRRRRPSHSGAIVGMPSPLVDSSCLTLPAQPSL